jgi:diketogulonate reductase-like aldo/keto reductase
MAPARSAPKPITITYKSYGRPVDEAIVDCVADLAASRTLSPAWGALEWTSHQQTVTALIIRASRPEHVNEAVAALHIELGVEELRLLDEHYRPRRFEAGKQLTRTRPASGQSGRNSPGYTVRIHQHDRIVDVARHLPGARPL